MRKYGHPFLLLIFVGSLLMLQFGLLCWAMPEMWHPWYTHHLPIRVFIPALVAIGALREILRTARITANFLISTDKHYLDRLYTTAAGLDIDRKFLRLVDCPIPIALCAGLVNPKIVISSGLLDRLSNRQLEAVLLHEECHRLRRDPLRILVIDALNAGLFFLPAVRDCRDALKARMEVDADNYAVGRVGRVALAGALHSLLVSTSDPLLMPGAAAGISVNAVRVANLLGERVVMPQISNFKLLISTVILWALCVLMI